MPHVPIGVKVVSILGIIYAGLWLLMMPCSTFLQFHPLTPSAATDALNQDRVYVANYVVSALLWTGMMVLLLVASIASLRLKPYARKTMLVFAWAHIVCALLSVVVSLAIVLPRIERAFASDPRLAPVAGMTETLGIAGAVLSALFYAAISAVILYFFTRPIAIDAFHGIFPVEPTNFPVDMATPPASGTTPPPLT